MIYIQYDFKPGYLVKEEDIKNFKYRINRYPLLTINNKIDALLIQELFLNYIILGKNHPKGISVNQTIINIYKNREKIRYI